MIGIGLGIGFANLNAGGSGPVPPEDPPELSGVQVVDVQRESGDVVYTIEFDFVGFEDGKTHSVAICSNADVPVDPPTNIIVFQSISAGGEQQQEFLPITTPEIVNPLYLRPVRIDGGSLVWGDAVPFDSAYPAIPGALTSVPNGFIRGMNFDDVSITNGATIKSFFEATFNEAPEYTPAAARWTLVTDDPTFGRIGRLSFTAGILDFFGYLNNIAYLYNVRLRLLWRANNVVAGDLINRSFFRIHDENGDAQVAISSNASGQIQMLTNGIAGAGNTTSATNAEVTALAAGWREWIIGADNDVSAEALFLRFYANAPDALTRDITQSVPVSTYVNATTPQFDGMALVRSEFPETMTMDFKVIEVCRIYNDEGDYIPIDNLGK